MAMRPDSGEAGFIEAHRNRDDSKPLRISLLAHQLRVAGGAVVGKNLLKAIGRLAPQHHYQISIPEDAEYRAIVNAFAHCEPIVVQLPGSPLGRIRYERSFIGNTVRTFRPDSLLGIGGIGMDNPPCPQALLLQDAHYFYPSRYYAMESTFRKLVKAYHKRVLQRQLKRTSLVFCQTPVARERIKSTFQYTGRIAVCPNALTSFGERTSDVSAVADRLRRYAGHYKLFYLANYYPHKNLEGIVRMFDRYRQELEGTIAVITAAPHHHTKAPRLIESIRHRGLDDRIINVGPIPQADLGAYYAYCDALLMPTFLESFSGTYLEAMHFGMPILTSDLDFARGICGDAAIYFDPWNIAAMKDAVLRLKRNTALSTSLIERGADRLATMFRGWDEIAADVMGQLVGLAG